MGMYASNRTPMKMRINLATKVLTEKTRAIRSSSVTLVQKAPGLYKIEPA